MGLRIIAGKNRSCYNRWAQFRQGRTKMDDVSKNISKQFGRRIRLLRQNRGFTQEELADTSGLHRSHMGTIERGEVDVTLKTLLRLGHALRVPLSSLLTTVQ